MAVEHTDLNIEPCPDMLAAKTFAEARDAAALVVYESQAFKIANDLESGEFELQLHRTHPEAPLSPVYLNLRPQGVKKGTLTPKDFNVIGRALALKANQVGLFETERYVAGIPSAGIPFMSALYDHLGNKQSNYYNLPLQKHGEGATAQIAPPAPHDCPEPRALQNVLLGDDLVTKLGTKRQAIAAVENMGGTVTDIILFVDRSGGLAKQELAEQNIRLHVLWDFDHLLEFWAAKGLLGTKHNIDKLMYAVKQYPKKIATFQAA